MQHTESYRWRKLKAAWTEALISDADFLAEAEKLTCHHVSMAAQLVLEDTNVGC